MKLVERYATACCATIGRQWALESFYPLPITRYITLHASSGMAAKNYPHYDEVVSLLARILNAQNIQIVQLGGKDDAPVPGCVHLQGKTDYHQSCYILKGSLLHLCNDTWTAHRAGEIGIPLVALYGSTSVANHSPYRFNAEKTALIESHRWGRNPSFASQEPVQSIGLIPPERVANEVLRILGITDLYPHQTRFKGLLSKHTVLDLVPNAVPAPTFLPELVLNVRMDLVHNEEVLAQVLATGRRINLLVNRPIANLNLLGHYRPQILSYTHELGAPDTQLPSLAYVGTIKSVLPHHAFFTREADAARLAHLRFQYLDHVSVEQAKDPTREDYLREALLYLNRADTPENRLDLERELAQTGGGVLSFRTTRYVLSGNGIYLSYPHMTAGQSITSLADNVGKIVDDPLFFKDINHYTIFWKDNDTI